jgi:hypothetical protein
MVVEILCRKLLKALGCRSQDLEEDIILVVILTDTPLLDGARVCQEYTSKA